MRNASLQPHMVALPLLVFRSERMSQAMSVNVQVPAGGEKITIANGKLRVPDQPIIPFIEGDGTGRDIWRASVRVFDFRRRKGQ
jgi:hypothetical protein